MDSDCKNSLKEEITMITVEPVVPLDGFEFVETAADTDMLLQSDLNHENPSTSNDCLKDVPILNNSFCEEEQPYQCSYCDKTFSKHTNRDRHVRYMHPKPEDETLCMLCQQEFKSKLFLKVHIETVHNTKEPATCEVCREVYSTGKMLQNHYLQAHPRENVAFCHICSKVFQSKYTFKLHNRQVHPSKNERVQCNECSKEFKNKILLKKHIKWRHPSDKNRYKCLMCDKILPSHLSYKLHYDTVHKGAEVPLACFLCLKFYKNCRTMKKHLKDVHVNDINCAILDKKQQIELCKETAQKSAVKSEPLEYNEFHNILCNMCNKSFNCKSKLLKHKRIKHPPLEAATKCIPCNKTYKSIDHLNMHNKAVHDDHVSHICDICQKEFKSRKYLLKHKLTHTFRKFDCEVCSKSYKSKVELRKHTKKFHIIEEDWSSNTQLLNATELVPSTFNNSEEILEDVLPKPQIKKPRITCPLCEKTFASKQCLRDHKRIVHAPPEAAQNCLICQKSFKSLHHLKIHMRSLHDDNLHICEYCQKVFKSRNYLMKHRRTHIDTNYTCKICSRSYKCKDNVTKHMKQIHGGNSNFETNTEVCNSISDKTNNLNCVAEVLSNGVGNKIRKAKKKSKINSRNNIEEIKKIKIEFGDNDEDTNLNNVAESIDCNSYNIEIPITDNVNMFEPNTTMSTYTNNRLLKLETDKTINKSLNSRLFKFKNKVHCENCLELYDDNSALEIHLMNCKFKKCMKCNGIYANDADLKCHLEYCFNEDVKRGFVEVEVERLDDDNV